MLKALPKYDTELQYLIDLSGLEDWKIAMECGVSTIYLSQIKSLDRKAEAKRLAIKLWLIKYIQNFLSWSSAA